MTWREIHSEESIQRRNVPVNEWSFTAKGMDDHQTYKIRFHLWPSEVKSASYFYFFFLNPFDMVSVFELSVMGGNTWMALNQCSHSLPQG